MLLIDYKIRKVKELFEETRRYPVHRAGRIRTGISSLELA